MNDIEHLPIKDLKAWYKEQSNHEEAIQILENDPRRGAQQLAKQLIREQEKQKEEEKRSYAMLQYEREATLAGRQYIAGTDEVGRGPLAGPVVAAAVILPKHFSYPGLRDSKKMSEQSRKAAARYIKSHALAWRVASVDASWIDRYNILKAAEIAMAKAVFRLPIMPDYLLVDGINHVPIDIAQQSIIGGDDASLSIAAASVLAKVWRDRYMVEMDRIYPGYQFAKHKGYGTKEHLEAIRKLGFSPIHRKSFGSDRKRT